MLSLSLHSQKCRNKGMQLFWLVTSVLSSLMCCGSSICLAFPFCAAVFLLCLDSLVFLLQYFFISFESFLTSAPSKNHFSKFHCFISSVKIHLISKRFYPSVHNYRLFPDPRPQSAFFLKLSTDIFDISNSSILGNITFPVPDWEHQLLTCLPTNLYILTFPSLHISSRGKDKLTFTHFKVTIFLCTLDYHFSLLLLYVLLIICSYMFLVLCVLCHMFT